MRVEVCLALPDRQEVVVLELGEGASVGEAIAASGLVARFAVDLTLQRVGVFSRLRRLADPLSEGDRVEIYRPLVADAKTARRQRARSGKAIKT